MTHLRVRTEQGGRTSSLSEVWAQMTAVSVRVTPAKLKAPMPKQEMLGS